MLFCAFDSMSYHLDSAIAHLKGGIKILIEQLQRSSPARLPESFLPRYYTLCSSGWIPKACS